MADKTICQWKSLPNINCLMLEKTASLKELKELPPIARAIKGWVLTGLMVSVGRIFALRVLVIVICDICDTLMAEKTICQHRTQCWRVWQEPFPCSVIR